ncbi:MAG: T9SS type A sorting domain-containing protein [bacterium]
MKIKVLIILICVFLSSNYLNASDPLSSYSTLWGWGGNEYGQLGEGSYPSGRGLPVQLNTDNWLMVSSGWTHSLGIKSDSTLWAWGENKFGELGNGTGKTSYIPIQIGTEKNWKLITAGQYSSFAIKSDGTLWAWGCNTVGNLGDSTNIDRLQPVQIGKKILGKVKNVFTTGKGAAAINESGYLFKWGYNEVDTLEDGTLKQRNYPVNIFNSDKWLTISMSVDHILAIKPNGTLWAWGKNNWGQLGDGTFIKKLIPVQIGNDSDWVDISCERDVNIALKKNGTIWAWGKNRYGELGDGTLVSKNFPVQIGNDTDWLIARSKGGHTEAVKKDGSYWYWGYVANWETLKMDTILSPKKMDYITDVIQLSRSPESHSLFLRNYLAKKAKIITLPQGKVTTNSAEVGGKFLSAEGEKIYQRGFCYDLDDVPTISRKRTQNGIDLGEYYTTLTNLLPFTKYYVRAYVSTAAGESYGETERIFTKLLTPILISPNKGIADIPLKADFFWRKDMNALKYHFQISKFSEFSNIELDTEVVDSTINIKDLELNSEYFWRVQTINGPYQSDWSEVFSFHTIIFNKQQLLLPQQASINIPIDCALKWIENTKSSQYKLQVSKEEGFNNFVIDTILTKNQFTNSKFDYLKPYYWRVKSFIGLDSSGWSPVWKFTTLMDSVKLISPVDLSANLELNQIFNWEKGIYEKNYRLQVAKDNDFTNMVFDTIQNKKNDADINNLKNYTKYFWRVRNESDDTLGYWSDIWQYRTRMTDVILIYPEDEKTGLDQKIKFKWSSVFGAEYYQLQISKNEQFTDIVYSEDSINSTEHNVPDFEPNKLYYWRVRPWNKESIGSLLWSEIWSFRTGETSVKDESEFIKITPNPAGDFITIALKPSEGFEPSESSAIQIYNTLGEKVMTVEQTPSSVQRINISDLPKGIYFVKVGGETAKFVKM